MMSSLTCSEFLEEMTDFLDESLDANLKEKIQVHIAQCPNCFVVSRITKQLGHCAMWTWIFSLRFASRLSSRKSVISSRNSLQVSEDIISLSLEQPRQLVAKL